MIRIVLTSMEIELDIEEEFGLKKLNVHLLDRERYKTVVLTDVPLENIRAGTQHSLEPRPVELHALERAHGGHGGGARSVQHQSDLPEVVGWSEDADLLTVLSFVSELCHRGIAENHYPVKNEKKNSNFQNDDRIFN